MAEKEYIEREALQEIFENRMQDNNIMCPVIKVLDVIEIIEKQHTSDVVPVRHGRWVIIEILCGGGKERKYYRCSECNKANVIRSNYCPNCGARMDEQ